MQSPLIRAFKRHWRSSGSHRSADVESPAPSEPGTVTGDALNQAQIKSGSGALQEPYVIEWAPGAKKNPYNWNKVFRWMVTAQVSLATFTVSFGSSAYSGGLKYVEKDMHIASEVAVLGISLYVLGLGTGPLLFAPLSEMYGRKIVFLTTAVIFVILQIVGITTRTLAALLVVRALSGISGASMITNAGGCLSDMWPPKDRGMPTSLYSMTTFLGPVVGPIVGGFVSESHLGWRFVFWILFILATVSLACGTVLTPETYGPVLLRRLARKLTKHSNDQTHYISFHDVKHHATLLGKLRVNLSRPFLFLVTEPIVACVSIFISVAYATLYALFASFPIVFQQHRGFTPGQSGLAFLGIGVGIILGTCASPIQARLYRRAMARSPDGKASPEERLHTPIIGGLMLPIGLFWFSWTTDPSIPWIVPILAGVPFGIGIAMILQGLTAYLMDAYTIYFASAMASQFFLRCVCAAAFPLFTPPMFRALGDEWACSVFAFISLACMPVPALFYKYGKYIRSKSPYAYKEDTLPPTSVGSPHEKNREGENINSRY